MLTKLYKKGEAPPPPPYGTHLKPDYCRNNCPRAYQAPGFVADWVPENPTIAFLFETPSKEDVTQCKPLAGGYGRFFWAAIGSKLGLKKENVIFSHVLRCYSYKYPTGKDTKTAEKACRYWDAFHNQDGHPTDERSLISWKPNIFLCTFGLDKMVELGAYQALGFADIRKALKFADAGHRPLVTLGGGALGVVAPWLSGGIKKWRGHWWEGEWKFEAQESEKQGFTAAEYRRTKRQFKKTGNKDTGKQGKLF